MLMISADVLALSSEAAVLVRGGRIQFANSAAKAILGEGCVGSTVKSVFGVEIAEAQAASFIGDLPIGGVRYIVRVTSMEGVRAVFLTKHEESAALINDALIYSLRNCLMGLGVTTEMLRTRAEEAKDAELLAGLASVTHDYYRINRMLSNVTLIRSINDGSLFFVPRPTDLAALLVQLADTVNLISDGPRVVYSGPEELTVSIDPTLAENLVLNLISNSLTHAVGCTRVSLRLIEDRERVVISVNDDGCGIAPEKLHFVFDRYRHGFGISDIDHGAGLGLTAALAIANLHGGTLLLESREEVGTTVRASFSRNPVPSQKLYAAQEEPERGMRTLLTGLADCLPDRCFGERYAE